MAGVRKIGFVVPPMAQAIDVSGPIGAFQEANRQSNGTAAYEMVVLSIDGSDRVEIDGMRVLCDRSLSNPGDDIDTLLVAGSHEFKEAYAVEDVLHSLRLAVRRVRRYGSVLYGCILPCGGGIVGWVPRDNTLGTCVRVGAAASVRRCFAGFDLCEGRSAL